MAKKKVYAALEIADREVRLLVFESFEGRENVLRVERVKHEGVAGRRIVNEGSVVKAINEALANAQAALGYRIDRVLLVIPAMEMNPAHAKVRIQVEDGAHNIRLFHVQQGLHSAIENKPAPDQEFVNTSFIQYQVDNEVSTKLPVGKEGEEFIMDVDSLFADRDLIYAYGRAIEQANLEIMDIFADTYAAGFETGAAGQSADRDIIALQLEPDHTSLTYYRSERMIHSLSIDEGYSKFIAGLQEEYGFSDDVAFRLLQNLFNNEKSETDTVIYVEQREGQRIEITESQLIDSVIPRMDEWIEKINSGCENLIENRKVRYLISGQGADIPVLKQKLDQFNAEADVYQPTNIGARKNALSTVLGLGYAYQNANKINHSDKISASRNEIEASLDSIKSRSGNDSGNFTRKMKSVILGADK